MREIIVKTKNIFSKVSYNLMLHTFGLHQLTCLIFYTICHIYFVLYQARGSIHRPLGILVYGYCIYYVASLFLG